MSRLQSANSVQWNFGLKATIMYRGFKDGDGNIVMAKEYLDHEVFISLNEAARFYCDLSENVMRFAPMWVKNSPIMNYDSYFFEALANSILSIKGALEQGHITDATVLLRNLFDSTIINLYFISKLNKKGKEFRELLSRAKDSSREISMEEMYEVNVSDWLVNNKTEDLSKALWYSKMVKCLQQESCISGIVGYLESEECKEMRSWQNDAVHLNHYKAILLNNGELAIDCKRKEALDIVNKALIRIVTFHVACVFSLKPAYLMSSDFMDYIDCGMEPPAGYEYEVAPFIQEYLEKTLYKTNPDWAEKLVLTVNPMRLRPAQNGMSAG